MFTRKWLHTEKKSKQTSRKNAQKREKRQRQAREGIFTKRKQNIRKLNLLRGVEYTTGMDTSEDLQRTKPSFRGKRMTSQETSGMKVLEDFTYIARIPG